MRKAVLFPYHPDIHIIVDYKDDLIDWEIKGIVSFKEDDDVVSALNRTLGVADMSYSQLLRECDVVIVLDNYRSLKVEKYYQFIEDAINIQKEIFVTPLAWTQLEMEKYKDYCQLLELMPDDMIAIDEEYESRLGTINNKLYSIEIPIVGVIGQGKHCGKFENQLLLKRTLEKDYATVTVSSNALGSLFGCYTMPPFLHGNIPFQEKILKFNYFIRKLSGIGKPDVVVLGIPEGMMTFNRHEFHHFAEYPLVVTKAVDIDMVILCLYFRTGNNLDYVFKELSDYYQNKYDMLIGAISLSRTLPETMNEAYEGIVFEHLNDAFLCKYFPDLLSIGLPVINLLDREKAMAAIEVSLEQLQNNIDII